MLPAKQGKSGDQWGSNSHVIHFRIFAAQTGITFGGPFKVNRKSYCEVKLVMPLGQSAVRRMSTPWYLKWWENSVYLK